ncbi:MAG TPA: type II toxin-antitoxin system RelE/ParE family toxin [Tepidisphaeraceae bacterium]|jgi:hypothetical protein
MKLTFAQVAGFAAKWARMRLTDEDLQALETQIMEQSQGGDVMKGTGGVRKIRFAPPSWQTGKSGATRVCYVTLVDVEHCYLLAIFAKNEKANLTQAERNEMRQLVALLKAAHQAD